MEDFGVYGVRELWRQMMREGFAVAHCTAEARHGLGRRPCYICSSRLKKPLLLCYSLGFSTA